MDNRKRLLWAGFMAILAAGVGFAIRGGIFANWATEFGFTATELGAIGGAGFTGFCFGIIIGGVLADKWGYGKLVVVAFACHVLSAVVTFMASPAMGHVGAYKCLFWGMFIFAYANGTLEGVANPLVATLFPENRTHYLNILHASWPAGLVLGGAAGAILGGTGGMSWKMQLALYLIPTLAYGVMFFGQHFPKSEASAKGLSLGEMFTDVGIAGGLIICGLLYIFLKGTFLAALPTESAGMAVPIAAAIAAILLIVVGLMTKFSIGHWLLFVLFITHALVGAVELGTDGWIQNITGNLLTPSTGKWLFVIASLTMFSLRFCANFIEKRIGLSPIGILLTAAIVAATGLQLISIATGTAMVMLAVIVYAMGKTFFWPTMLAVASDRFPRTGAIAISIMGGIGMMSAGLIGSPGLGYCKDRFASEELNKANPAIYAQYKTETKSRFLFFDEVSPLDGKKLGEVSETSIEKRTPEQLIVHESNMKGDRRTLKTDAVIPATMATIYLLLILYFKARGGYQRIEITHVQAAGSTKGP